MRAARLSLGSPLEGVPSQRDISPLQEPQKGIFTTWRWGLFFPQQAPTSSSHLILVLSPVYQGVVGLSFRPAHKSSNAASPRRRLEQSNLAIVASLSSFPALTQQR